ncbi:MAG TPA: ATP-binding protein [Armatimonadota bacterium]|jgi:SpoVK/Ycf46/Vps4 family AAA+-type ATPase
MLWDLFKTEQPNRKGLVEWITPRKTFDDVILPARTRKQLRDALTQIEKHNLIFEEWGLGHRHTTGLGLGFNFAGPPGTGKSLCAEALAQALGRVLCRVKYSQLESMWAGESGKNVAAVFREAKEQNSVLFFDEADAIASRRLTNMAGGYEREANQVINILLKELEEFEGVIIFATNLATNFDPAFERRIRTHIYFELPGPEERRAIWIAQLSRRTPLGEDVDFTELADRFELSGGDIKNAVLKAAQMAAGEEGPDADKRIHHRHFVMAAEEVIEGRRVMQQTLFEEDGSSLPTLYESALVQGRLDTIEAALQNQHVEATDLQATVEGLYAAAKAMDEGWTARIAALESLLSRGTHLPLPAWAVGVGAALLTLLGGLAGHLLPR